MRKKPVSRLGETHRERGAEEKNDDAERSIAYSGGIVIARTPDGKRSLCRIPKADTSYIEFLRSGKIEPIGTGGTAVRGQDGYVDWIGSPP